MGDKILFLAAVFLFVIIFACANSVDGADFCKELTQSQCGSVYNDAINSSIQEHSGIGNNFCFDPKLTSKIVSGCDTYIRCSCVWINNNCMEVTGRVKTNPTMCTNTITSEKCITLADLSNNALNCDVNQGSRIAWTSKWNDWNSGTENASMGCASGEKILPCSSQSSLGFFGFYNFAIALIAIFITYYFLFIRIKKRGKDARK